MPIDGIVQQRTKEEDVVRTIKKRKLRQAKKNTIYQIKKEGAKMIIEQYVIIRGPEGEREVNLKDLSDERRREIRNHLNTKMLGHLNYVPEDKTA